MHRRQNEPRLKEIHVAIDVGTTYTASAYSVIDEGPNHASTQASQLIPIRTWPEGSIIRRNQDVNNVPTVLLYKKGKREPIAWGWAALKKIQNRQGKYTRRHNLAERFKLLLSRGEEASQIREDLKRRFLVDGRSTAIDLFVDFLRPVREHVLRHIQRDECGDLFSMEKWTYHWTFSVPADWSLEARRMMQTAVKEAGYVGTIKLISEPEASALYILETRAKIKDQLNLENAAVVGDLGGGTIDTATYQIASFGPLSLGALARVNGRIIGSENLNDEFRKFVKLRLRNVIDELEIDSELPRSEIYDRAVLWFGDWKGSFEGDGDLCDSDDELDDLDPVVCECPIGFLKADKLQRFRPGALCCSLNEMKKIFDRVVDQVIDLLLKQIMDSHSFVQQDIESRVFRVQSRNYFLTGGLSGSPYLRHRVREAFEMQKVFKYPVPVTEAIEPETAVVKGAVWRSLHPETVTVRISETSYGFCRDEPYDPRWARGGPPPVKERLTGKHWHQDRMKWVVKMNTPFRHGDRFPYHLHRCIEPGGSLRFEECLFYSDVIKEDHIHYVYPDIHKLATFQFSLEAWRNDFKIVTGDGGNQYMMVEYDLVCVFEDDDWRYEIEVLNKRTQFKGRSNISASFD